MKISESRFVRILVVMCFTLFAPVFIGSNTAQAVGIVRTLTTSSTDGGSVTVPGEGEFTYPNGTKVTVQAEADTCYEFVGWTGTAVDWGKVADPNNPVTTVTLWKSVTLIAHFQYVCSPEVIQVQTLEPQIQNCTSVTLHGNIFQDGGDPDCWAQFRYFKKIETFTQGVLTPEQEIWTVNGEADFSDTLEGLKPGCTYVYQAIAGNSTGIDVGEYVEFTLPECGCTNKVILTAKACAGGQVCVPGQGIHMFDNPSLIAIKAQAYPGYAFSKWEGSGVDANKVADPNASHTTIFMDANYSLYARFVCLADEMPKVIYVDDDAVLNCTQDGTRAHPYGQVQVGILAAKQDDTVVVLPGMYHENLNFLGKPIRVMSLAVAEPEDPNAVGAIHRTVLHGSYAGTVVTFKCGEDARSVLSGFTLMGGRARTGGAIQCINASPIISNCVITGNRATRGSGGAIDCTNSEAAFFNCTITDNYAQCQGEAVVSENSLLVFLNCVIWSHEVESIAVLSGQQPAFLYCDIQGWTGQGSFASTPGFINPGQWVDKTDPNAAVDASTIDAVWLPGDYHILSEAGRYDPVLNQWVLDAESSPCIDTGDPAMPTDLETQPHGERINIGAYGGTLDASRTGVSPVESN